MSFGLTNAPSTFIDLMNRVFKPYFDMSSIMFIDVILIYSRKDKDYASNHIIILQTLKEKKMYAKFSKCEFWIKFVAFVGHIVFIDGLELISTT